MEINLNSTHHLGGIPQACGLREQEQAGAFRGYLHPFQILGDAMLILTSTWHFFYLFTFLMHMLFFFLALKKNELVFASLTHLFLIVWGLCLLSLFSNSVNKVSDWDVHSSNKSECGSPHSFHIGCPRTSPVCFQPHKLGITIIFYDRLNLPTYQSLWLPFFRETQTLPVW